MLEIGPGLGATGARLARRYEYTAVELDEHAHRVASARINGEVLLGDIDRVVGETFDVVCAFEVLEHIADDVAALQQWRRLIRPGGAIVLSVPAGRDRLGPADVLAGHFRRYERDDLVRALIDAGFSDPAVASYGYPIGFALEAFRNAYARRRLERFGTATDRERTLASGRWLQPGAALGPVTALVALPFRLLQRPFSSGTGIVATARAVSAASGPRGGRGRT